MTEIWDARVTHRDDVALYRTAYWPQSLQEWPIYPFCYEETIRNERVRFFGQRAPYMLMVFLVNGEIIYFDGNDQEYILNPGNLLLIPQFSDYAFVNTPRKHYHKLVLEIKGSQLMQYATTQGLNEFWLLPPETAAPLVPILRHLGEMLQNCVKETVPEIIGETIRLLTLASQQIWNTDKDTRLLTSACAWLERNLSSQFTIVMLAQKMGISHAQLDWMFRAQMGMTPQQYRINYRIKQAEYLLSNTAHTIKDIALRLGYANQLYFSTDFKKHFGASPKLYRENSSPGAQPFK